MAYIEFALTFAALLMLFLGSLEITRYILIMQKLEKTIDTIVDVTTQANPNTSPLNSTTLSQLMSAVQDMMSPYPFNSNGFIVITDVTQSGTNNPVINWQYCANSGSLHETSKVGTANGGAATLPGGFTMNAGEEIVIGEIFYSYVPITSARVQTIVGSTTMYKTVIYLPRLGSLTSFSSTCP